ncbi:MAG: aminoacyl-tRNA hydrolase [Sedimentisphaerales bacterium]|nr:aminoacyl-tRNA hydrolase [Sedimentisphaerales bacterium]
MKLIVGLGNPGRDYVQSRHNVGFDVVNALAARWRVSLNRHKHHALAGEGQVGAEKVMLLQPQTYMNRSGVCVSEAVGFYRLAPADLMVILDDMALTLGRLRLRANGSAGGHNGLADIIDRLGYAEFSRLRIGIGSARPGDAVNHVLGRFSEEDRQWLDRSYALAVEAVECWLIKGIAEAMSQYNGPPAESGSDNKDIEKEL